jgi:antitoxin Phd
MKTWQLQSAKARLSQLIQNVIMQGPQKISIRGVPKVVILTIEEYDRLAKKQISFVEFITQSPLSKLKINLKRDKSLTRDDIDL